MKDANPYLHFNRDQWAQLRDSVPLTLTESDLETLRGINESLSLHEVEEIYLPLSRLLNLYVQSRQNRCEVLDRFLGRSRGGVPYIIGIAGSVAGGKSTTARILQALLERWPEHPRVALVTTDGFLYPNAELQARGLMRKKGFPESYNIHALVDFVSKVRAGHPQLEIPIYSHLIYDIIPDELKVVEQPDILILEGLNVLQSGMDYPQQPHRTFVSDFIDFSIYVDADTELLEEWYLGRFRKLRASAFTDPHCYFHRYAQMPEDEALSFAKQTWAEINYRNLCENILPTRERANLILTKGIGHAVEQIKLRK